MSTRFCRRNVLKLWCLSVLLSLTSAYAQPVLRVITHDSFAIAPELLKTFETQHHVTVQLIKGGDAGEMLNKLILTKDNPLADVVFGIDNSLFDKARGAYILAPTQSDDAALVRPLRGLAAIDYGWVTLNYDRARFTGKGKPKLPSSLEELTKPAFRNMLVLPNAATSSTGMAFLLATIEYLGEQKAFDWWRAMRANGAKIAPNWTAAYYTDFSKNGGPYPLVVSYASSPAAEVFFSQTPLTESPTANLFLRGGVYEQVEGAAVLAGAKEPQLAQALVNFLQSAAVQADVPRQMWMWPARKETPLPEVFKHASQPTEPVAGRKIVIKSRQEAWLRTWLEVMTH